MSAPQVGDVITTAEELDTLPVGSIVVPLSEATIVDPWQRLTFGWDCLGGANSDPEPSDVVIWQSEQGAVTLVYLPGQPPRPERVVKAEALREAASSLDKYAAADVNLLTSTVVLSLRSRADRIERVES